jgi:hypothetical protein
LVDCSDPEVMRSSEHRLAVQLFCNNPPPSLMARDVWTKLPDFLVAWRGDFPANSILCLDRMKVEANKSDTTYPMENWRTRLEPLFEKLVFVKLDKSVQHRLICLVTTLGSPTPAMMQHWSAWIARGRGAVETTDTSRDYAPLMIQCMHGIRHQVSVKLYLGFLIDATGVLQDDVLLENNWAPVEARIEEVCWALQQIGATIVLPKLVGIFSTMIEQGRLRLVAKVLAQFTSDLGKGESIFDVLPELFAKRLVEECCRVLVTQQDNVALPILDLLRDDSAAMQLVLTEMYSMRESHQAMSDLDRLLDFLLNEVILSKRGSASVAILMSFQALTKPSSALHVKIEGIKRNRAPTTA